MENKYTQDELNQILLSKPLDEFYLAIIEKRNGILTDEEYDEIVNGNNAIYTEVQKEEIDNIVEKIKSKYNIDIMRIIYRFATIRRSCILTRIGDDIYDIANTQFIDLKRDKIIHFDNITNYYDDTNTKIRLVAKEEDSRLKQDVVLIDTNDDSIFYSYEASHINEDKGRDLTKSFISKTSSKPNVLVKKINNKTKN